MVLADVQEETRFPVKTPPSPSTLFMNVALPAAQVLPCLITLRTEGSNFPSPVLLHGVWVTKAM